MRPRPILPLLFLAASCGPAPVLQDYSYIRGYSGEGRLRADIEYAAGRVHIGPSTNGSLFELKLRYDPTRFRPIGEYGQNGEVRLGAAMTHGGGFRIGRRRVLPQTAEIGFSPEAALDLRMTLGAGDGVLDLGGLRIQAVRIAAGASRTAIRFAEPNPEPCASAEFTSGAGELTIEQAGNGGCPTWRFEGGVGAIRIDLAGAWRGDPRMNLSLAVGGVVFEAPQDMGIRVRMEGLVAKFEGDRFSHQGKTWTSEGFDQANRKVDIEVRSAVGGVRVEWK